VRWLQFLVRSQWFLHLPQLRTAIHFCYLHVSLPLRSPPRGLPAHARAQRVVVLPTAALRTRLICLAARSRSSRPPSRLGHWIEALDALRANPGRDSASNSAFRLLSLHQMCSFRRGVGRLLLIGYRLAAWQLSPSSCSLPLRHSLGNSQCHTLDRVGSL